MKNAKANYLMAKAEYETVSRLKKECQVRVLTENKFKTTEGETATILNDYMMNDADSIKYWELCFEEYKKVGLNPVDCATAVDHKYYKNLRKAEDELLAWGLSIIKTLPPYNAHKKDLEKLYKEIKVNFKIREKVIDLTLALTLMKKGEIKNGREKIY